MEVLRLVTQRRALIGFTVTILLVSGALYRLHHWQAAAAGMSMSAQEMATTTQPPATSSTAPPGYAEIRVPGEVRQRIGVILGEVQEMPLTMAIRTVGIVRPDETKVDHIHLKTEGWVQKLFVNFTGQEVKVGEPLLSIYSQPFFAAEGEFLSALQSARLNGISDRQLVVQTARKRLELWDIPEEEIDALEKSGRPTPFLTLRSPISGTVLEKKTFEGQYVMPASDLFVVADLSTVWMQAKIYEYELPHVALGMPVKVFFPWLITHQLLGKIVFIDPVVDEVSRTVQVRVELPNRDGRLKPGMFGDILITHAMGDGLTVPASAVLRSGERDIVFRAVSDDRFVPVQVKIGAMRFGDRFQILAGLKAGDEVAISGNYLIDSESRLEAGGGMAGMPGMGSGTGSSKTPATKTNDMKEMPAKGGASEGTDHAKAGP